MSQNYKINEKIRAEKVRLINENGENLGIIEISEALRLSEEAGMDLVEVSPDASPPVCRILDYGKLKYQQNKKSNKSKKTKIQLKEIRVRPKIGEHDLQVKLRQAKDFIESGNKVLFSVNFRGRESTHLEIAKDLMDKIKDSLEEVSKVEKPARLEGRKMYMILAPR